MIYNGFNPELCKKWQQLHIGALVSSLIQGLFPCILPQRLSSLTLTDLPTSTSAPAENDVLPYKKPILYSLLLTLNLCPSDETPVLLFWQGKKNSFRLWCTDNQWFDDWTLCESFQWPHIHLPQVSLSVQPSKLLFVHLSGEGNWIIQLAVQDIYLAGNISAMFFIKSTCHVFVRVNHTKDEESANMQRQI